MRIPSARLPRPAAWTAAVCLSLTGAGAAEAHVKWFCAYDVVGAPRGLETVLCDDFEKLAALSVLALVVGGLLEGTVLGAALTRSLDRVTGWARANTELLFRAVCGGFFVALWSLGGVILTPELTTTNAALPWLQLAIAVGFLWRATLPFSAAGIVALFAIAASQYGAFHLADYPIFLGVAVYLVLTTFQRKLFGLRPLDVVRYAAAITLMWASVEKWAYPQWTFPLFLEHPAMTMGFDGEYFMKAAGAVEFVLAFALVCTPLIRRIAAILLGAAFVSAIFQFGKIDAIGHAPIIVAMVAIAADDVAVPQRLRRLVTMPVGYATALACFIGLYYGAHAALYGSAIL
ncbi:MAG: hypothetical protein Q7T93_12085 [Methylobacterium sp.]|uniref:hypothetical protein n=1 Tax=unclassified Methylobacterium TaxID=2615210 RepID=UPI0011CAFBE1|nr:MULTISPECIES: hypothetical protein [unclassified Methylobacterium]MDO9427559.1 hypothetical protein [Methylobacterium sp.]TXM77462.1 hypothetical protein FV218_05040 [Methylobacterium sp. WL69]